MALKLGKCRLCLKLGDFYSIFSVDSSTQLAEMAMACAQVKIFEGDGLPDKICGECVEKLSSAYIFKQQCERSDQDLRRNYVPPPGFSHTPPPNRQSSDSGYSNRTDVSFQPKAAPPVEEPIPTTSSSGSTSNRKRKRTDDEPRIAKSLLQESFSLNIPSPVPSDHSRPKTPDKRPRYEQDSDYEYSAPNHYSADSDSDTSQLKCEECDRTFTNKTSLALHRRVHKKQKKTSILSPNNMVVDIPIHANVAPVHTDTTPVHTNTTPAQQPPGAYACPTCSRTFKLQIMLKRHSESCREPVAPAETEESPFKVSCNICNAKFKTASYLSKHMRVIHGAVLTETPPEPEKEKVAMPCLFCETPFTDYYNYVAHFNTCPDQKKLPLHECLLCNSKTTAKPHFFRHVKEKHFGSPRKKYSEAGSHEVETFHCRICSQQLATQDLLVTHLAAHMSNIDDGSSANTAGDGSLETQGDATSLNSMLSEVSGNGTFQLPQPCKFCDKSFKYKKSLDSHVLAKHSGTSGTEEVEIKKEVIDTAYEDDDFDFDDEFGEGETDNTCDICEKHFSYRKTLLQHKRTKHTRTAGHKRSKVSINKCQVKCLICDITMFVKEIKAHNQVHIDASFKPRCIYTCSECGGNYKGFDSLRTHIKYVHRLGQAEPPPKQKQYTAVTDVANFCEVVVTKTEPMDYVQGHNDYRSVPGEVIDGVKPIVDLSGFTCPLCNKKMQTLISLKRHINWHNNVGKSIETKTQIQKCQICDLEFRFNSHYKLHMKEHYHDTTLDPKFLTCAICNRKSKHLRAAQSHALWHKQTRFSNKDYECSICKRVFQYRKIYLGHMAVHYKKGDSIEKTNTEPALPQASGSDDFTCPHCSKVLDSANSLKCHISWHTSKAALFGSRYECEHCSLQFTNKRRHELHVRTHYEDEAGPYMCPICSKGYNNEEFFQKHVKGHNFDNEKGHEKRRQKLREKRLKKVQCPICCRFYPDLLHLVRHIKRSHPQSKMIKEDPDAPPSKVFSCKLCAKIFLDEKRLQTHEEMHLRKPMHYHCKFCGYKSISSQKLNVHVKGHLTQKYREKPLECSKCGEKFVVGYALHHHLRDAHGIVETWIDTKPAERPIGPLRELQCSLCLKVLATRSNYERHIDYHNTLRCSYCFEYFNRSIILDGHLAFSCEKKKLIGDTEVHPRRVKCSICYKAFHLQVKLECHMWTQHGVREFDRSISSKVEQVCDYCFRVFDNEEALTGHKVYHRTIGYYGCLYCNRKFNTITMYRKHKNQHLSQLCIDNPVKCEHCDETFEAFRDFIYHMRDEHGDGKEWIVMPKGSTEEECNICHKVFINLHRHMRYHEENRCRKCREYFYSRADFDAHLCHIMSDDEEAQVDDEQRPIYQECTFCFKQINKKNSKLKHDILHKTSGALSCRFCPLKFKTLITFNIHAFSHRTRKYKKNPLVCYVCHERFVTYGAFMRHMRGDHKLQQKMHYRAVITPEPCVVCNLSFPNLHNHYRAHLQHQCVGCHKYFTSNKLFTQHECGKEDADPSKVFTSDENLPFLINTYVPKEDNYEEKYYGHAAAEVIPTEGNGEKMEANGQTERAHEFSEQAYGLAYLDEAQAFSEGAPVISGITSLNRMPKKVPSTKLSSKHHYRSDRSNEDDDDDCVVILVGGENPTITETICLDD